MTSCRPPAQRRRQRAARARQLTQEPIEAVLPSPPSRGGAQLVEAQIERGERLVLFERRRERERERAAREAHLVRVQGRSISTATQSVRPWTCIPWLQVPCSYHSRLEVFEAHTEVRAPPGAAGGPGTIACDPQKGVCPGHVQKSQSHFSAQLDPGEQLSVSLQSSARLCSSK